MASAPEDPADDGGPPIFGRAADLPAPDVGPPAVVALLGLVTFITALWNLERELAGLDVLLPPVAAFLIGVGLAGVVWYGAYRLSRSAFGGPGRWLVAGSCLAGGVAQLAVAALTVAVRLFEGRAVAELPFVLFTSWGTGTVGGLLVGWLYARVRRDALRARRARDRFSFLNSTLRHDVLNAMMIVRSRAELIRDASEGEVAGFADTIVDRADDVVSFVERVRSLLTALSDDRDRERPAVDLSGAVRARAASVADAHDGVVDLDGDGQRAGGFDGVTG
ncbi:MAG: hypothetical protein ABEH40_08420 [Haloferacaceae archaeon]